MSFQAFLNSLPGGLAQGLIWALLAIGVYITYRILDFADITVDGSLATGGAVTAVLIADGMTPILALAIASIAGMAAGLVTGLLNTKLKIPPILSGILTMSALYSINLRILGGASNLPIFGRTVVNTYFANLTNLSVIDDKNLLSIIVGCLAVGIVIAVLYWFFGTEIGCSIRATGSNPKMALATGINTDNTKLVGLALSNGLAAMCGSLLAQHNMSADVNMGAGTIVIGLASVIIGEVLVSARRSFWIRLAAIAIGSVIYRLIFTVAVQLGLNTNDLKLVASVIVVLALLLPRFKSKLRRKKTGETDTSVSV